MKSTGTEAASIEVLLVEDSPGDVRLTREAFKDAKVLINLHVASDGTEAMAFLNREGEHANVPRPDLGCPWSGCRERDADGRKGAPDSSGRG
jgi:hypothetical protein